MSLDDLRSRVRMQLRRAGLSGVPAPVVAAAGVLAVLALVWALWRFWPGRGEAGVLVERSAAVAETVVSSAAVEATAPAQVWVHVVGAVRRPGVYRLAPGDRVADAVEAAGGLLGDAAAQGVNLARVVTDGEQIVVPTADEWAAGGGAAGNTGGGAPAAAGAGAGGGGKIDINSADAAALDTLPGVGPATAAKIVADREANGPYANVDDLGRVPGIGDKKLDALKDLICAR